MRSARSSTAGIFSRPRARDFLSSLAPSARADTLDADAVFATAFQRRDGAYGAAILSEAGKILHTVDLPDRGHDITFDPVSGRSVVFARQPGTFAVVFDPAGQGEPVTIQSVAGRHFFGHGVFSPDGALLYATENDFDNAAGMVGIYDARSGFARIGEFPTHGVGPHELLLLDDGRTHRHRQWRHRDPSGFRPRQAQHSDHEAVLRASPTA